MSSEDDTYSTMFTALKHPIRRKILRILNQAPATYTEILNQLNIDNGLLNYHLDNMKDLVTKNDEGKYHLSEFGEAAVGLTEKVEEAPTKPKDVLRLRPSQITALLLVLVIAVASVSGLYTLLYKDYRNQTSILAERNVELDTANAKLTNLSSLAELANVSLTPPTDFPSGIQIVKLTKLDWTYQKITESISFDDGTGLIVFYVPIDGSVIHLELTNSPYNGYEFEPTAQRGIAWRNETWVKIGTVKSVFNVTRPDDSEFVWESPVVWSLKTMGNGVFESSPLGRGWYTFNLFGAFTFLQSGYMIGQPLFGNHYQFSGDSFRADATFRLLSGGKSIFFAAARPRDAPWGTIQ
jgi:DNA-binding transcriptional ArsR family regulator